MPAAALPAATRLFRAGNAVAMTGNGLVLAFTSSTCTRPAASRSPSWVCSWVPGRPLASWP
jgi:hypothetical protein